MENGIPWVEKYRPTNFDKIILNPINRRFFENVIAKNYFPNMLFYGEPGCGKTTTILNLINIFLKNGDTQFNKNVIHLNASDERGIDIIRNQINTFVQSNSFFNNKIKIVIFDEVDCMTERAQQALKYLLQTTIVNVRFCLICNYISKIDISLQNEFICIRFNQLPKENIMELIQNIVTGEKINIDQSTIEKIYNVYRGDIRSIINFIQLNQTELGNYNIIDNELFNTIINYLNATNKTKETENAFIEFIHTSSCNYNTDKTELLLKFFNYLVESNNITTERLTVIEYIVHNLSSLDIYIILRYLYYNY